MNEMIKNAVLEYFDPILRFKRYLFPSQLTIKERVKASIILTIAILFSMFFFGKVISYYSKSDYAFIPATVISKEITSSSVFVNFEVTYQLEPTNELVTKSYDQNQWNSIKEGTKTEIQMPVGIVDRENRTTFLEFLCTSFFWIGIVIGGGFAFARLWKQLEE